MDIAARCRDMGRGPSMLGAWAAIASVGALAGNAEPAISGEGYAITRVLLGLVGLIAASLFWSGRNFGNDGLRAIMIWGILQIPAYAQVVDGNFTKQLIDFPMGMESSTTVNGVITEYSQIGINLIGILIVLMARSCRSHLDLWRRRSEPALAS